jgi:hypothetical protein
VTRLESAGFAASAIADKELAKAVADHKSMFFSENDANGKPIDYHAAVSGGLQLVPSNGALKALAEDYRGMVDDGLLLDDVEEFDALIKRCLAIQTTGQQIDSTLWT